MNSSLIHFYDLIQGAQVRETHIGQSPKACVTRLSACIISRVKMNSSLIHFYDLIQGAQVRETHEGKAQRLV